MAAAAAAAAKTPEEFAAAMAAKNAETKAHIEQLQKKYAKQELTAEQVARVNALCAYFGPFITTFAKPQSAAFTFGQDLYPEQALLGWELVQALHADEMKRAPATDPKQLWVAVDEWLRANDVTRKALAERNDSKGVPLAHVAASFATVHGPKFVPRLTVAYVEYGKRVRVHRTCAACGERKIGMQMCGRCNNVWYCSRDCQKAEWSVHKKMCNPMAHDVVSKELTAGQSGSAKDAGKGASVDGAFNLSLNWQKADAPKPPSK